MPRRPLLQRRQRPGLDGVGGHGITASADSQRCSPLTQRAPLNRPRGDGLTGWQQKINGKSYIGGDIDS